MKSSRQKDEVEASTSKLKTTTRHEPTLSSTLKNTKSGIPPPRATVSRLQGKSDVSKADLIQAKSVRKTAATGSERGCKSNLPAPTKHENSAVSGTADPSPPNNGTVSEPSRIHRTPAPSSSAVLRPPSQSAILRPSSQTSRRPLQSTTGARPAFSTLQQHFSPAKSLAPKPATATFLAPPSPSKLPTNVAIDTETTKLQTELLQLHLLHSSAIKTQLQWRRSARTQLEQRWQEVQSAEQALAVRERARTEEINASTLQDWYSGSRGVPGLGLSERIPVLESVITGVWALSEPGGKYARCVQIFEEWLAGAQRINEGRASGTAALDVFFGDIGSAWKDECGVLTRRLFGHRSHLTDLGVVQGPSSLAMILEGCKSLTYDMMAELESMQNIEMKLVDEERQWISAMCDELSGEDEGDELSAGPIWKSF